MTQIHYTVGAPAQLGATSPSGISLHALNPSAPDAASIVTLLNQIANAAAMDGSFRLLADYIFGAPVYNYDLAGMAAHFAEFVRQCVVYAPDPNGTEYVKAPLMMLQQIQSYGSVSGDCDDHCVLFQALCSAYGITCRTVAVRLNTESEYYDHVICETKIGARLTTVDLCAKNGAKTPDYLERVVPATEGA